MPRKSVRDFLADLEGYGSQAKAAAERGLVGMADMARTMATHDYSIEGARNAAATVARGVSDGVKRMRENARRVPADSRTVFRKLEQLRRK